MIVLQIEHEVLNFKEWKKAFENDPVDRRKGGVFSYKILQRTDNPNYVVIELEFENLADAENMHTRLQTLWKKVDGTIIIDPRVQILNLIESKEL